MAFNSAKSISSIAIALALATFAPSVAFSQSANPAATPSPATGQPASPSNRPSSGQQGGLNLTPQQRERIQAILTNRQRQIEAILTQEQRTRVEQAQRSGQDISVQSLNLTENQIARIRSIIQTSNDQIKGVLTAEQLRQLETQSTNQNR